MTKDLQVRKVNFNGDELMAVKDGNKVYVGIKWVCKGLKLTSGQYQNQTRKIGNDDILKKGVANIQLPTNGGIQDMICIDLDYLPLWLAKINTRIIKDKNTKEKVVSYQLHVKDVLANAFVNDRVQPHSNIIIPQNYHESLLFIQKMNEKFIEVLPKAQKYDEFLGASGWANMNQTAKALDTGRRRLFAFLRSIGILNKDNTPKQQYIEQSFFKSKPRIIFGKLYFQTFVSSRGIDFIYNLKRKVA